MLSGGVDEKLRKYSANKNLTSNYELHAARYNSQELFKNV